MSEIFRITEASPVDEGIKRYEWHECNPVIGTNLNGVGDIRLTLESQDTWNHPAESYLEFEGRLTRHDGAAYGDDDAVAITNNGLMHLFNSIKYSLNSQDIETVKYPGQATTMLGLLKYPDDFAKDRGLNQLWAKDTTATAVIAENSGFAIRQAYLIRKPAAKGTFSFVVPLKHIFGFCEDYDKVIFGMRHTLTLARVRDDDAIFRTPPVGNADAIAAAVGRITLQKISWYMPIAIPALAEELELLKPIKAKASLPVSYRGRYCDTMAVPQSTSFNWRLTVQTYPEKPRYIIVGFQTNKSDSQLANPSTFDHCRLRNMYVTLNTERYPGSDYVLSFPNQQFSRAYRDAATFSENFYGMTHLMAHSNITPSDYKDLYPLFVFDVSKQSEGNKPSVVDVTIRAFFDEAPPAATQAYAVVISDKFLYLASDGNKLNVVYN